MLQLSKDLQDRDLIFLPHNQSNEPYDHYCASIRTIILQKFESCSFFLQRFVKKVVISTSNFTAFDTSKTLKNFQKALPPLLVSQNNPLKKLEAVSMRRQLVLI